MKAAYRQGASHREPGACLEIAQGGGPNRIFRQTERRSRTFFWLSPISNVKFGVLRGGGHGPMPPL